MTSSALPIPLLHGIVPPLITPLLDRDVLDVGGLERLMEHVVGGGVHGLFILGTSGELASLSGRLRREVIDRVVKQVNRRVPVVAGVTDTSVVESIALARCAADAGVDAIVLTVPYYVPPDQDEIVTYVQTVAGEQPLPVLLYNFPSLTKTPFDVETVLRLADDERIIGMKDSSGDLRYLEEIARRLQRTDWSLLTGVERLLAAAVTGGLHGCVGGGANVYPRLLVELYEAALRSDVVAVALLQTRLDLLDRIYRVGPPGVGSIIRGMKTALSCLGICSGRMADPYRSPGDADREQVRRCLVELGLLLT